MRLRSRRMTRIKMRMGSGYEEGKTKVGEEVEGECGIVACEG